MMKLGLIIAVVLVAGYVTWNPQTSTSPAPDPKGTSDAKATRAAPADSAEDASTPQLTAGNAARESEPASADVVMQKAVQLLYVNGTTGHVLSVDFDAVRKAGDKYVAKGTGFAVKADGGRVADAMNLSFGPFELPDLSFVPIRSAGGPAHQWTGAAQPFDIVALRATQDGRAQLTLVHHGLRRTFTADISAELVKLMGREQAARFVLGIAVHLM